MSTPGFDEHLDLAVRAGYINSDDYTYYTTSDESTTTDIDRFKGIKKVRKKFKPVNYSAVYGVGVPKLSRTTGMSKAEAKVLLDAYWERNWAVKQFAADQKIRTINGQMWVKNPVNNFWYSLRYEKDVFSTLNQSTGAYCFDQWVAHYLTKRPNIIGQFHDESINRINIGEEKEHEEVLRWAIDKVNEKLKLNIKLDIDVQFGLRYSDIH
jgi:DNA polymerase I-like protein with 3'-5' exonuclease and polymerase domains